LLVVTALEDFDRERDALKFAHEQHVAELARLHDGHLENEAGRTGDLLAAAESEAEAQQSVLEQYALQATCLAGTKTAHSD